MIPGQVWGARPDELLAELPCDSELSGSVLVCDRAISVDAPAETVFDWCCQLRVASYSYELLDVTWLLGAPLRRRPRTRSPELTDLAVGQRFMGVFDLVNFTPGVQITLRADTVAVTYSVRPYVVGPGSRLHVRVCFSGPGLIAAPLAFGDFFMMRKQLLTLKELAEREALSVR
ncbi:hypothetical protein [Nocardia huaxiensis]|uniref:Polyketide cyclase/dehydrase/lipid transport protein n=1 Tax=Nocardia huaxiensis TaxID=2755382 RepID=A0A7D6VJ45_9NOCA|nr:hypothetical protein [Nocardia huaxiensis]QLY31216.1 hypothetical protein H0264_02180 [Nocardia huaxiensis]UFS94749.1 hypothetical protein LPY97_29015 [Nocardia huaxiensis]